MTFKDLLEKTDFDDIFHELTLNFGLFDDMPKKNDAGYELLLRDYFKEAVSNLKGLEPLSNSEYLLCVFHCKDELADEDADVWDPCLLNIEEVKKFQQDSSSSFPEFYGLLFNDWKEVLGMEMAPNTFDETSESLAAATVIHEITFFGNNYEKVKEKEEEEALSIEKSLKEIESGIYETYPVEEAFEGIREKYGFEKEEISEEEQEKEMKRMEEIMEENRKKRKEFLMGIDLD